MKNFNTNTKNNDEWLTPPDIVKALGPFDLDPCQPIDPPFTHADTGFNINDDGLSKKWFGRVWLNPPYGRETGKWLKKMKQHKSGLVLIFARTETQNFFKYVWNGSHSIFFFKSRLKFHYVDGTQGNSANAPSCLVSYSIKDTAYTINAIRNNKINGKLLFIDNKFGV